ncbi:PGBM protein, partial [Atractosteus spatula]|nr:PGBM protein [Atractosteus spatula]
VCAGERVTLHCQVEGKPDGWRFSWYRNNETDPVSQTERNEPTGSILTFSPAAVSQSGQYRCRAARGQVEYYSEYSDIIQIRVSTVPETHLTLLPSGSELFTGDNVTLSCDIGLRSSDWFYSWYKDSPQILAPGSGAQYTIQSATLSHRGQYWCRAARDDASFQLSYSQPVTLHIAVRPQVELTLLKGWTEAFISENITLNCMIPGGYSQWSYKWYKNGEELPVLLPNSSSLSGVNYTLTSATVRDSGQYTCSGQRTSAPYYSNRSRTVSVRVSELFTHPVLSAQPGSPVTEGDSVTLHCDAVLNETALQEKLQYRYFKEGGAWKSESSEKTLTIPVMRLNHTGRYWCEVEAVGRRVWKRSNQIGITVKDQSLILQTPPQPLTEGQTLTLQCRERKSQAKRYEFYKGNEALTPDNGNTVTISAVKKRNEGLYRCQRSKASSQPVLISVRDLFSQVTLRASPGARVQEGEPVNLTCEAELTGYYSSSLSYSFFRDGQPVVEGSSSALYSMAKVNWTLTGSYSCVVEAEHGIRKNSTVTAVTLAVSWWAVARLAGGGSLCLISLCAVLMLHYRAQTSANNREPKVKLSPPGGEILEGDTVTLECEVNGDAKIWSYFWFKDRELDESHRNQSQYRISSVSISDSGDYRCYIMMTSNPVEQHSSKPFTLQVLELFTKPSLSVQPWQDVWEGETISLHCQTQLHESRQHTAVQYHFWKGPETVGSSGSAHSYTIAAQLMDSGEYKCEVRARGVRKTSDPAELHVTGGRPRAGLSLQSRWREVCAGERVTLHCRVEGKPDGWRFSWYRNNERDPVSQTERNEPTGSILTFSPAAVSQTGQYRCRAARGQVEYYSEYSDIIQIRVSTVPETHLTLLPSGTELFTGDNVTLSCDIGLRSSDWLYSWYKDSPQILAPGSGAQYTIQSAALSHRGQYWCRPARDDASFQLSYSQPVTLHIAVRPQAELTLLMGWTEAFISENITLNCMIPGGYSQWSYKWYKNGEELPVLQPNSSSLSGVNYTLTSATVRDSGQYTCSGQRASAPYYSNRSRTVSVRVSDHLPTLSLTQDPDRKIFEGDKVVLRCGAQDGTLGWLYFWYKDNLNTTVHRSDRKDVAGANYSITAVGLSHKGLYWCGAERGEKPIYLNFSQPAVLEVHERPQAVVSLGQEWSEVYAGESAVLRCSVPGSYQIHSFDWYKDEHPSAVHQSEDENWTILSALESHTGHYSCQGRSREKPSYSKKSSPVKLKVQVTCPRTVLSLQPMHTEVFEGDTVTLSCVVEDGSPGWSFYWYKDSLDKPAHNSQSSNYIVSPANLSHSGQYWCQAVRGQRTFYLNPSLPIRLNVLELTDPALSVQPGSLVTEGDSVALHCHTALSDQAHERLHFSYVKEGGDWKSESSEKTLTIPVMLRNHTGQYWCEVEAVGTGIKKRSNETGITVRVTCPRTVLSLQPMHTEVFEGDTVTLSCVVEDGSPGWSFYWYKDSLDKPAHNSQSSNYIVSPANLSHSGQYWCQAVRGQRTFYLNPSLPIRLNVLELTDPALSVQPGSLVTEGDSVALHCHTALSDQAHERLHFSYVKEGGDWKSESSEKTLTIPVMLRNHTGQYWCEVEAVGTGIKKRSNETGITVRAELFHRISLTVLPLGPVWEGETLTLHCTVQLNTPAHTPELQYTYIKDGSVLRSRPEDRHSVTAVRLKDSGKYLCGVEAQGKGIQAMSSAVEVNVTERPQPRVTQEPAWQTLYSGEPVTLRCLLSEHFHGVEYLWFRGDLRSPVVNTTERSVNGNSFQIFSVVLSDRGQYLCLVHRGRPPQYSQPSDPFLLNVSGHTDAAESLTMGCRLGGDSSRRQYSWYRVTAGGTESVQCQWENRKNCQVTFRDKSHSGLYWCEAQSGQERSKSVHFRVLGSQENVLISSDRRLVLQTPPQPLTEGQTLTLQCRAQNESSQQIVGYTFYKDNETLTPQSGNRMTIAPVKKRDEGLYRCRVTYTGGSEDESQLVLISIRDLFSQVTLRASPGARVQEGEPVNLTCEAELTGYYSSSLSYSFFRDGQPVVEGSSSALYSMAKVNWTLTGSYSCVVEAEHGIRKNSTVTAVTLAVSWWAVARLAGGGSVCLISLCAVLMLHYRAQTSDLLPTLSLTQDPDRKIFEEDAVVLRCGAQDGTLGWLYSWYKDNLNTTVHRSDRKDVAGASYFITAVDLSHKGLYWCGAERGEKPIYLNFSQPAVLEVHDLLPTLSLTQDPDRKIFEEDAVVLRCGAQDGTLGWLYSWYKDNLNTTVHRSDRKDVAGASYFITAVDLSHKGLYWCGAERGEKPIYLNFSQPAVLEVHERPRAVVSLGQEWSEVYAGESAVLRCSVPGSYPMQSFEWYKDEHTSPVHQSEDENWTILSALESHIGHYSCQGRSRENPSYSKKSSPVKLKVQVTRPRTVLSLQRLHTEVFEGDTVTLCCVVEDGSPGWSFYWYKDILDKPEHKSQSSSYIVSPANLSHTGQYWCQAARGQKPFYLNPSQPISLIVLELTDPALSVQPGSLVTEGDSVALHCHTALSDQAHERLHFSFVKEGGDWKSESSEKTLTIPVMRRNHTGQYWCEVEAVGTGIRKRSNETGITVRELFHRISLTVLPLGPVWEGETLTLHCTVQLNTPAHTPELQYTYVKDGRVLRSRPEDRHAVPAVRLKDSGKYLCGVEAQGKGIQAMSSAVEVNVTERPQPRVTQEPAWEKLYYGEPVTLRCLLSQHFHSVEYLWFRGDLRSPVFNTTERSVNGNSLQISSVVLSDQGQYLCLVRRGRPTQYSQPSDPFLLNVSVDPPKATLRLHPDWTVLFPAESLTMGCRLGGDSSRRQYSWYRVTAGGTESVQCQWENGTNCQVTFRDKSHSGLYWCEAQSGQERSKSVHFRVLDRRLVLQTPPQPLTEGQMLTLQCRARNESSQQIVGYTFYKDNETLKHTGNITTIAPVKKQDEGLYRCRVTYTGGSGDKSQPVLISIRGEPAMDWHSCLAFVVCWVGSGFPQHLMA